MQLRRAQLEDARTLKSALPARSPPGGCSIRRTGWPCPQASLWDNLCLLDGEAMVGAAPDASRSLVTLPRVERERETCLQGERG